jgi:hypothetical protein
MKAYLFYLALSVFVSTKVIGFFIHEVEAAQAKQTQALERAISALE